MRIEKLHIYGFGQHSNKEVSLSNENIQVFFGENEAGKSTIMAFIKTILFGFPNKSQKDHRFEPKNGTQYGGKISLLLVDNKRVTVERIQGKSVTLFWDDGKIEGDEGLVLLFKGMDRSLYQSIFSFDIHGLQGIEEVKADEISEYLLTAGAMGNQKLLKTEKHLTQKMDDLFKPNGKKPLLNERLHQLESDRALVMDWSKKLTQFEKLQAEQENVKNELERIEMEIKDNQSLLHLIQKKVSLQPYVKELVKITYQLNQLPKEGSFPQDGLEKMDTIHERQLPLKGQLRATSVKKAKIVDEIEQLHINKSILNVESTLRYCLENKKLYTNNLQELESIKIEIANLKEEIEKKLQKLSLDLSIEDVIRIDTTLTIKENLKNLINKEKELLQQKAFLENKFQQVKHTLEESETKINYYKKQILEVETRKHLETQLKAKEDAVFNHARLSDEIVQLDNKLRQIKSNKVEKSKMIIPISLFILFAIIVAISLPFNISTIFIIVLPIIIFLFLKRNSTMADQMKRELEQEKKRTEEECSRLKRDVNEDANQQIRAIKQQLFEDDQATGFLKQEQFLHAQHEQAFKNVVNEFEAWEQHVFEVYQQLEKAAQKCYLPKGLTGERLFEAFLILEELKEDHRMAKGLEQKKERFLENVTSFQNMISELTSVWNGTDHDEDVNVFLDKINDVFQMELAKRRKKEQLTAQLEELVQEETEMTEKIAYYEKERQQLMAEAEVQDEDGYRKKGKLSSEAEQLMERVKELNGELYSIASGSVELIEEVKEEGKDYQEEVMNINEMNEQLYEKQKRLGNQLLENRLNLDKLAQGNEYSDVLHEYEWRKSDFNQHAKKWAALQLAQTVLMNTKRYYMEVRLPKVLNLATTYFTFLTEEKYKKIFILPEENRIIVERSDGIRFNPKELSQATSEQLYLAVRFALANVYKSTYKYPIIIDDSFVNFDANRLAKTMELVKKMACTHQVLFFTCHRHLLAHVDDKNIISL